MSYYNLCGTIGSQHSNISKGKKGGVHIKITGMQDSKANSNQAFKVDRNKNVTLNICP
jgi:hypothetical protein